MKPLPLVQIDPWLKPFSFILKRRAEKAKLRELEFTDGKVALKELANNHLYYGLFKTDTHWVFREKAPNAKQIFLMGDFSYWQPMEQYALHPIGNGDWEIQLPLAFLKHGSLYKLWMVWDRGADERLPSHVRRVVQDEVTKVFSAQVWDPEKPYVWKNPQPQKPEHPLIYEAHIGMSSQYEEMNTYWRFKEYVLPRIKKLGYNTIQLMAIQEHPYYGSFGYQVANFYAPSARFGTPEELMELIDTAHGLGISVILDVVHSHSVSNVKEGLSLFDGSDNLYFHSGNKGYHPVWDSRCFNYGKTETVLFLLSNLKYWLEIFKFDGFRFDGVTSMSYWNHGIGVDFLNYKQYFDENVDEDAIVYLTLANKLIKGVNPNTFTIAEDVSGMPGMAFPVADGGIGFDFRMSMGISDFWSKLIKERADEQWSPGEIYFRLTDKRAEEQTVSYAESHDQAMVGDKTIIFRLIDKEMYTDMSAISQNLVVDRGIALHKLIRLLTLSLAQGGYLNFMGNEFGHPEWIDFPREGNNWSFQYARRQWNLVDDDTLKYKYLNDFDAAIIHFVEKHKILATPPHVIARDETSKVLACLRNGAMFVYNLHPTNSYTDYEIYAPEGEYKIVINSDSKKFSGFGNIDETIIYKTFLKNGTPYLRLYLPARTGMVLSDSMI
ncbi:MAG: alpha-amylase family glycosyl hydrolase [Bacteroidetes bacterium]|nr:alpha-amylase family glycosyl hydrolase [Bacteroidota bacterium]MCL1968216.1 alpha-amylase family glycosyl hydrolase [Bacteroidota bacterium]